MPTHDRRGRLPTVIAPLLDDPLIRELIVVVDGGDDGSYEWLQSMTVDHPRLRPLRLEHSQGAQVARDHGLRHATAEVVLFLDDDILADRGLAAGHLAHHLGRPGLVVVGYMPVDLPSERQAGQFATYLYADEYLARCRNYEEDPAQILRTLWWGNVSMRRSDALSVGMVGEGLEQLYHEDQEFGLRCLEAGLVGVFDRSLTAHHLHSRSVDAFVRDARAQGAGRAVVHHRHRSLVGELSPSEFEVGLPYPAALLVRWSRHHRVAAASTAVLRTLAVTSGRFGWFGVETESGKLLRRVNQRSGAEAVWRGGMTGGRTAGPAGR